jgi:hypothetical protein
MVYDSQSHRWLGNEEDLAPFNESEQAGLRAGRSPMKPLGSSTGNHARMPSSKSQPKRKPSDGLREAFASPSTPMIPPSARAKKPSIQPSLIRKLGSDLIPIVIGEMKFDPIERRWIGNDDVLKDFGGDLDDRK